MKIKMIIGALLIILFTSSAADAQYRHRGYGPRYRRGYYRRPVVVVPPRPVVVHRGYYGPGYRRGYYRRGYYGPRYGYRRGYYGRPRGYGYRRHRRGW